MHSLKRNYFFSVVSALTAILYPIVTVACVARALGPESLGKYYFASSLASYFLFLASMGIPVHGSREVGRTRANPEELGKRIAELFLLGLIASVVAGSLYAALAFSVPEFRAEGALLGVLGFLFVANVFTFDYVYVGFERQDWNAYRSMASKLVSIVLILAIVRGPEDYVAFAAITVAASALNAVLSLRALRRASLGNLRALDLRRHFKPLLGITGSLLFLNVYLLLDSVILGMLKGAEEVGLYGIVARTCRAASLLASSVASAALPRLAWYADQNQAEASQELQRKSFDVLCLVAVPAFFTAFAAAPRLLLLISGSGFSAAAPTLMLGAPLILSNSLSAFLAYQVLLPFGKERLFMGAASLLAAVNLAVNLALIPMLGRHGAVIAALLAEAAFVLLIGFALRGTGHLRWLRSPSLPKYAVAGGVMAVVLVALREWRPDSSAAFVGTLAIAGSVYGLTLLALREPVSRQVVAVLKSRIRPG